MSVKSKYHAVHPSSSFVTVMFLSFWTDRSGQTVQTQIRKQSDQGLHYLQFCC